MNTTIRATAHAHNTDEATGGTDTAKGGVKIIPIGKRPARKNGEAAITGDETAAAPAAPAAPITPVIDDDTAITDDPVALQSGWERISTRLRESLGDAAWRYHIRKLQIDGARSRRNIIVLKTASMLTARHAASGYADTIRAQCRVEWPHVDMVEIRHTRNDEPGAMPCGDDDANPDTQAQSAPAPARQNPAHDSTREFAPQLREDMTFDNFITDESNLFAVSVAQEVAEHHAAPKFNPLYLHGGVGLGKTHLLQAIAAASHANPADSRRVLYMTSEDFARRFIAACHARETLAFKEKIRAADLLMVDDIRFLGGKTSTCEEFRHTFDALAAAGKQIVVTADRPPAELEGMEDTLRSRLNQGMVARIDPGTHALRLAVIERTATAHALGLDRAIMEFLAANITANLRDLEGALNRLIAHHRHVPGALDMESVRHILADMLVRQTRKISIAGIKRMVAAHYGIRVADIDSKRRPRNIVLPRQIAMYLAKTLTPASYPEIGRHFGGRDHTTVMYAVNKIQRGMDADAKFAAGIAALAEAAATADHAA